VPERPVPAPILLGGWPGYSFPDLNAVATWLTATPMTEQTIEAGYHDTDDLRLVRSGIAIVHRPDLAPSRWTVELPVGPQVDLEGPAESVPLEVGALLAAHVRDAALVEVTKMRTRRSGVELFDRGGRFLGRVVDDEISVLDGDDVAARFRELAVHMAPGAPPELGAIVEKALRSAGATDPDPLPRLARALGPRALAPADAAPPVLGPAPSANEVIHAALAECVREWLLEDLSLRRERDLSLTYLLWPLRGLFGLLHGCRDLFVGGAARELAGALEPVLGLAHTDSLLLDRQAALTSASVELPPTDDATPLLQRADAAARVAREQLLDELDGKRYVALVQLAVETVSSPPFVADSRASATVLLPVLTGRAFTSARKTSRGLDLGDAAAATRAIERLDRARVLAEASTMVLPAARPVAAALTNAANDLLSYLAQVEAGTWVRAQIDNAESRQQAFIAGELAVSLRRSGQRVAEQWERSWKKADRKKARAWLAS
jgi:hypothetical protein